jgi:uncharacterized integral membrane protein (TIGR00698 family)
MVPLLSRVSTLLPGVALCIGITLLARLAQIGEEAATGHPYVEALVLAILIGAAVRTVWQPTPRFRAGIAFSAKMLLEIAIVLLGAAASLHDILAAGPALLAGVVGIVAVAIAGSYLIGRALGLAPRMATLVACGNSICGNSAIAAVAPVIGADGADIAASIAFTALLGVVVVLILPLLIGVLGLSFYQYGVLAGLTVYAVPQVLAATMPVAPLSVQIGTLVKLVRVLMLGPVVLVLSLWVGRRSGAAQPVLANRGRVLLRMVPWFIIGFVALAVLRSAGLVPVAARAPLALAANLLTVVSMAALGLGVDVRVVGRLGGRVSLAAVASLVLLAAASLGLIRVAGIV